MINDPKLYNSRLINVHLIFLRERYPHVSISEILDYAGIEQCEAIDEGCWFSQQQIDLFVEKATQLTSNRNLAREAGRFAISPGAVGVMRQYFLGVLGPTKSFQLLNKTAKSLTRSAEYTSRSLHSNQTEIAVTPYPGVQEKPFQCHNRIGIFEAIVSGFNLELPQIEHPECIFDGGSCCRYIITWKKSLAGIFSLLRTLFFLAAVVAFTTGMILNSQWLLLLSFPVLLPLGLLSALLSETIKRKEVTSSLDNLWGSSERLAEVIADSASHLHLIHQIGETLANKLSIDDALSAIIQIMQENLDFDCGAILLTNKNRTLLEIRGAFGYSFAETPGIVDTSFSLTKPDSQGPLIQCFHQQKPIVIDSTEAIKERLSPKSQSFVDRLGIDSFICCPIIVDGVSIGVLAVNNHNSGRVLIKSDATLLQGIAPVIGVALKNADLIESLQMFSEKTIQVLADSIDARDYLTSGHSQQVTYYAELIARDLDFSDEQVTTIRIAGLLHDYGKIGVPDSILCKDGPLTTEERAIINTHPVQTEKILNQIPFPDHQKDIPRIAGAHHERWDGAGYPHGLKADQIPLASRIIAVADFFEAITSRRHYRSPMPVNVAVSLLEEGSGTHFDPAIVQSFLRVLHNTNFELPLINSALKSSDSAVFSADARATRVDYQTQVSVQCGRKILNGRTLNISEKGLFIQTDEILENRSSLVLTLCPPGMQDFVHIISEVVWVNNKKSPASSRHPHGFGVRFNELSEDVLEAIRRFVKQEEGVTLLEKRKVNE